MQLDMHAYASRIWSSFARNVVPLCYIYYEYVTRAPIEHLYCFNGIAAMNYLFFEREFTSMYVMVPRMDKSS